MWIRVEFQCREFNSFDVLIEFFTFQHEHEVIHRDIKGANVLVDLKMKDVAVLKIADFGTSKQLSKISNLLNTNMKGSPNIQYFQIFKLTYTDKSPFGLFWNWRASFIEVQWSSVTTPLYGNNV